VRLEILDTKQKISAKIIAQLVRFLDGFSPDIVKVFLYRKEFFGDGFQPSFHEVMRAGSAWTPGERELMAAFVSSKNACRYCTDAHRATAAFFVGDKIAEDVVASHQDAEISAKLQATLTFLEKLTLSPRDVGKEDVLALERAGVSAEQIESAIEVCAQFCIVNRLADTFGVRLQSPRQLANEAKALGTKHYKF
jgi:uncharacterized peroxidase-related enzyme